MIFLITIAFLATVVILLAGGLSMVRGGKFDDLHGQPLMEARVILQALTLLLLLIAVLAW